MRSITFTHNARHGALLLTSLAITMGLQAQRAEVSDKEHDALVEELVHKHDKEITFTQNSWPIGASAEK